MGRIEHRCLGHRCLGRCAGCDLGCRSARCWPHPQNGRQPRGRRRQLAAVGGIADRLAVDDHLRLDIDRELHVVARLAAVRLAEDHTLRLGHDELPRRRRRQGIAFPRGFGPKLGQGPLDPLALGRRLGRVDQRIRRLQILHIPFDRHLVRGNLGLDLLPRLPPLAAAGSGEPAAVGRHLPRPDQPTLEGETNDRQVHVIAAPLLLRKSAMVLKSGCSRHISQTASRSRQHARSNSRLERIPPK